MATHTHTSIALCAGLALSCVSADPQNNDALPPAGDALCASPVGPSHAASPAALAQAGHAMVEGTVQQVAAEWEPLYLSDAPIDLADCQRGSPTLRITLTDVVGLRGASVPDTITARYASGQWNRAFRSHTTTQWTTSPILDLGEADPQPTLNAAGFLAEGQRVGLLLEPSAGDASYLVAPAPHVTPYLLDDTQAVWVPLLDPQGNPYRPACGGIYVDYDAASGMSQDAMHAYLSDEPAPNADVSALRTSIDQALSTGDHHRARCTQPVSADRPEATPIDSGL